MTRIFLIDDEEMANYSNELIVKKLGVFDQIDIFSSAIPALKTLKELCSQGKQGPELLLLDLNMPLMNGFAFLTELSEFPDAFTKSINVIVLTSSLDENDRKRAMGYSMVKDLVKKPLNLDKVKDIVSRHTQGKQA